MLDRTFDLSKEFSDKVQEYAEMRQYWQFLFFVVLIVTIIASFAIIEYQFGSLFEGFKTTVEDVNGRQQKRTARVEIGFIELAAVFAPMYSFFAWLLVFIGNRRAEHAKIEEIYKHKEITVKNFFVYKKTIEELMGYDKSILVKHIDNLLEVINKDPSSILISKGEKHPVTNIFRWRKSPSSN